MKYLFIMVLASTLTTYGMESKVLLEKAFHSKNSYIVIGLCQKDPHLITHLKRIAETSKNQGEWGLGVVEYIEKVHKPVGRIRHDHHPVVEQRQQEDLRLHARL